MAKHGFWKHEEVLLMKAWLADLTELGYNPPAVQNKFQATAANVVQETTVREYAVCLTGQADRSATAVPATIDMFKAAWEQGPRPHPEADIFTYISTYDSCPKDVEWVANQTFNYSVLYNDKKLQLPRPKDESSPRYTVDGWNGWLQQHYGLQRCLELVQDYASQHHVTYQTLIRLRTDHVLTGNISALVESFAATDMSIHIPVGFDFGGYNDRIAWGPISLMQTYMNRLDRLHRMSEDEYATTNFHAESFLSSTLANVSVTRVDVSYDELPKQSC